MINTTTTCGHSPEIEFGVEEKHGLYLWVDALEHSVPSLMQIPWFLLYER